VKVKRCADFCLKMKQKHLAAEDPLELLTALLQTPLLDLTSRGGDKGRGRERDGRGENMRGRGDGKERRGGKESRVRKEGGEGVRRGREGGIYPHGHF